MARKDEESHPLEAGKRHISGEGERVQRVDAKGEDIMGEFLGEKKHIREVIEKNADDVIEVNEEESGGEKDEDEDKEDEEEPNEVKESGGEKDEDAIEGREDEETNDVEEETPEEAGGKPAKSEKQKTRKPKEEEQLGEDKEEDLVDEEDGAGKKEREDDYGFAEWDQDAFDKDIYAKEPVELKAPSKEEIKKTILEKAADVGEEATSQYDQQAEKLSFLSDAEKKVVFIGRKANVYKRYGYDGALQIGRVQEKEFEGWDVYLDSLNPHVVFVCGARGSGKCLTGDTLITLDNGEAIPIKELEARQEKVFALGHSLEITQAARTDFFKRTVDKTLKVRLQSGKEIELTPEHPLLTLNGWRPAENLSNGDRIATPRVLPAFGSARMKECDVKLLAYLIAEGHLSNQFVLFSNMDEKIIAEFRQSIAEFDPNLRIEQHSKPGCFRVAQVKKKVDLSMVVRDNATGRFTNKGHIIFKKSSIRQWLEGVGLYGKLSAEKFIPKEVMQLEKGQLALFLNRMFSCDGSIYRINRGRSWAASIGFVSQRMTREIQHLLLRFGILSTFRKKKTRYKQNIIENYEVVIYGENVIKFIEEIGFFGEKEVREQTAIHDMAGQKRNPNFDTIPKEIWQSFQISNAKMASRELGHGANYIHSAKSYAPSRKKLLRIAEIERNVGIRVLANSDIYWDTIKEITEINGEKEVYDITVPIHHNFVANDIVVHNSYVIGVIAEELAERNKNVGTIVVDPIGVFWSMRFPNKEEKEIEKLKEWGLETKGLNNLKVFIPEGVKGQVPRSTYDAGFAMQPSLLTGEDWTLTFGVDRFSVSGLLLDKVIKKVEKGYRKTETNERVEGKGKNYSLNNLIECLETDSELNSRERGYKPDSIRAIISRFEAAKSWGIFSEKGTPLRELSREGQLTVLDTSFLEDNVTALVIGILARRLLAARKISTRKEAASKFKSLTMEELLELEVPPTWLFIDEAHTLIPSGNEVTAATAGLIEYVKQGRRPGLSLVFATQQPSAINTKVLSQLDVIMTHKLIFDDDIKAVFKRTPTIIPRKYRTPNFVKTLPVGVALTGDRREETSRAFVMGIRPRKSQHEGRDAETTGLSETVEEEQVQRIAEEMLLKRLKENGVVDIEMAKLAIDTLNAKYNAHINPEKIIAALGGKGIVVTDEAIMLEGVQPKKTGKDKVKIPTDDNDAVIGQEEGSIGGISEADAEGKKEQKMPGLQGAIELQALPQRIGEEDAKRIVDSLRERKILGLFGGSEKLGSLRLKYMPIWRIKFDAMTPRKEFISRECFVNSLTGELIHFVDGKFLESRGMRLLNELGEDEVTLLKALTRKELLLEEIMAQTSLDEGRARRILQKLVEKKIVERISDKKTGKTVYYVKENLDLPPHERHEMLGSLANLPFVKAEALNVEKEIISKDQAAESVRKLWNSVIIKKVDELYKPVWDAVLERNGKMRNIIVDAVNGKAIKQ